MVVGLALLLLSACSSTTQSRESYADELLAQAKAAEPTVTARLRGLAKANTAELIKLEYRLKSRSSLLRKIGKIQHDNPGLPVRDVVIDDALRYTMKVADDPPGHYVAVARKTLAAFEQAGHTVVLVKNYWPDGDGYSGLNCILNDRDGLRWELQFHTAASLQANRDNRPLYEESRRVDTPMERKRELFDQMAARWQQVPIPTGVLSEAAVHSTARVIHRPRP